MNLRLQVNGPCFEEHEKEFSQNWEERLRNKKGERKVGQKPRATWRLLYKTKQQIQRWCGSVKLENPIYIFCPCQYNKTEELNTCVVHMCTCAGACSYMCACLWRPELEISYLPLSRSTVVCVCTCSWVWEHTCPLDFSETGVFMEPEADKRARLARSPREPLSPPQDRDCRQPKVRSADCIAAPHWVSYVSPHHRVTSDG